MYLCYGKCKGLRKKKGGGIRLITKETTKRDYLGEGKGTVRNFYTCCVRGGSWGRESGRQEKKGK